MVSLDLEESCLQRCLVSVFDDSLMSKAECDFRLVACSTGLYLGDLATVVKAGNKV